MSTSTENGDHRLIPVVEERAVALKRRKVAGGVRVRTVVHEDEEVVAEPFLTEEVEVERITLDRWVEAGVPVRQEGETTIITLFEEVVVVERRLKAVEEVRITKKRTTQQTDERVTLRREEAVVERLDGATEAADPN